ncbi:oxidation resistance protein 1 [Canna indica]|uniref:Oxidation resistance protein 1 n=1 Tax=Canna indica TaxID=4628 RepID=A0AAQ3KHG3_9LILI|nr:oxidation resistance protein 1 [Canna indica]
MGYAPSVARKEAHLVSNVDSNPISDEPPSKHPEAENPETNIPENEDSQRSSKPADSPDTISFATYLFSRSVSRSSIRPGKVKEHHAEVEKISTTVPCENSGRKSILARGKESLARAIHKAANVNGFRHSSVPKVDSNIVNNAASNGSGLTPVTAIKDTATLFDLPCISEFSLLLSENMRAALHFSLPALAKGKIWVLLYSTRRDGRSLSNLYRRSALCPGYSLLVVGDQKGAVFGGFVEAPLQPANKYQGTNSSFVFTDLSGNPVVFRPTGMNHYFTLCSSHFLALGGGGSFALYLDEDLLNGSSSCSQTYGNSCLAHSQEFEVKEVELWGFVYASKFDEMIDLCQTKNRGIYSWYH